MHLKFRVDVQARSLYYKTLSLDSTAAVLANVERQLVMPWRAKFESYASRVKYRRNAKEHLHANAGSLFGSGMHSPTTLNVFQAVRQGDIETVRYLVS